MLTSERWENVRICVSTESCEDCQATECVQDDDVLRALLRDRAEMQAEVERLMTRNGELSRLVDRYTGTDYTERLHAVARAAQEIVDGLPYRGVIDFPELREELRELAALERDHD